eukprot:s636_g11.t2
MNSWAAEGIFDCNFLCICVLGDRSAYGLCKEMSNQMKLTHCVNGFVESARDMPTYGQLGCQGFIILDKEHKVVSEGTSPFMQVRALAFQHVEALLNSVCKNLPLPDLCPGEEVQLVKAPAGLEKLQGYRTAPHRSNRLHRDFQFCSDGPLQGKVIAVPRSSVERLEPMDEESMQTCSNGTCGQGCSTSASKDQQAEDCGSCNGGTECDPSNCDRAECHIDPSFVSQALDLISVKVASMDSEHEECAVALRRLVETRSREVLEEVLRCLSDHFAHEEKLCSRSTALECTRMRSCLRRRATSKSIGGYLTRFASSSLVVHLFQPLLFESFCRNSTNTRRCMTCSMRTSWRAKASEFAAKALQACLREAIATSEVATFERLLRAKEGDRSGESLKAGVEDLSKAFCFGKGDSTSWGSTLFGLDASGRALQVFSSLMAEWLPLLVLHMRSSGNLQPVGVKVAEYFGILAPRDTSNMQPIGSDKEHD